jgi:pyruvate dehydrogenase E2 component (dihydrolipoamide acetyltransferase)
MPSLGADMDSGTLLEWLVEPGSEVHRGDIVAVVDTSKAAVEVEVFDDGVVDELLVPVGRQVPVGTLLATLLPLEAGQPAAPPPEPAAPSPEPAASQPVAAPSAAVGGGTAVAAAAAPLSSTAPRPGPAGPPRPETGQPAVTVTSPLVRHLAHQRGVDLATVIGSGPEGAVTRTDVEAVADRRRVRASPYARRRAAELGVDVTAVTSTGSGGVVRADDVERFAGERLAGASAPPRADAGPDTAPAPTHVPAVAQQVEAPSAADRRRAMRRTIATLMSRSKREVPHYYLSTTIDMRAASCWIRDTNRSRPLADRLLPVAVQLRAVALALREVPDLNGSWRDDAFVPAETVHLGLTVALRGGGLVTPAILGADSLRVDELMLHVRDLVARSRAGRLRRTELTDATCTVTHLGDQGVESVYGIIYPPQVALVGLGRVVDRPWAVDGLLGVRPVLTATLAADHRASDGHVGARFLATLARLLQQPETL